MNNRLQRKKKMERLYLENFLSVIGLNPTEIRDGKDNGEEPDFVISIGDSAFGVELTALVGGKKKRGDPMMEAESLQRRLKDDILRHYYERSKIPIQVQFISRIPKDTSALLAQELVARASSLKQGESEYYELLGTTVRVRRLPRDLPRHIAWQVIPNHVGWSRGISRDNLQMIINKKLAKLHSYRSSVNRVILLIYSDRTNASGMVHFPPTPIGVSVGDFAAVYLYLYPSGECKRIGASSEPVWP